MSGRTYELKVSGGKTTAPQKPFRAETADAAVQRSLDAAPPSRAVASVARGLSKRHIITESCVCRVSVGASAIELRRPHSLQEPPRDKQAKRQKVKEWTAKSRMRLKWLLGRIKRDALAQALFVTLTYPAEFPAIEDHDTYKNHLRIFLQSVRRHYQGRTSGVWKLEFQQRGAAHFHILVLGVPHEELLDFRQWVARRWFETVGSGDEKHLHAGTSVEAAMSIGGAMCYLGKYISKDDQTRPGNFTGRYWGVFGSAVLPVAEFQENSMSEREVIIAQRWARKLCRVHTEQSRWKNFLKTKDGQIHGAMFGHSRQTWERLRSMWHGGGKGLIFYEANGSWSSFGRAAVHFALTMRKRPPGKHRMRNNTTVRLICHADVFWSAIERARKRGLLEKFTHRQTRSKHHEGNIIQP